MARDIKDRGRITYNLVRLMEESGVNGRQLAEGLGISKSAVNYWVSGVNNVSPRHYRAICDFFDVPIERLLDGDKRQENGPCEIALIASEISDVGLQMLREYALFLSSRYPREAMSEPE